jgi:ankyrin repeat protein
MACSHIKSCELFVQFALNPALDVWKENYCETDFKRCVRYQNSLKNQPVPLTLLPNGKMVSNTRSREELEATVIFNAILKNRTHMVGSLIRAGVNVNLRNLQGMTPLMAAAEIGNEEAITILLNHNADATETNEHGETAYDIAIRCGNKKSALLLIPSTGQMKVRKVS